MGNPAFITLIPAIALLASGLCDAAEKLISNHGVISATEKSPEHFSIALDQKNIGTIEGLMVSFYRIVPKADTEHIIVEARQSGLYCRQVFRLIELSEGKTPQISKSFGDCRELEDAGYSGKEVYIDLVWPQGTESAGKIERVHWTTGQIQNKAPL